MLHFSTLIPFGAHSPYQRGLWIMVQPVQLYYSEPKDAQSTFYCCNNANIQ